jgi:hypothetical protein
MAEPERDHRQILAQLRRSMAANRLSLARLLNHFGIPDVPDEEVEAALITSGLARPPRSAS